MSRDYYEINNYIPYFELLLSMLSKVNYILSTEIDIFDFENIEKSLLKHKVKNTVTDLLNNIYLFVSV